MKLLWIIQISGHKRPRPTSQDSGLGQDQGQPALLPFGGPPPCPRNGSSSKRKRQKVAHRRYDLEEGPRYQETENPAKPSEDIRSRAAVLMLKFSSASSSASAGAEWVEGLYQSVIHVKNWAEQEEATASDTLLHLAQRCRRAETVDIGMRFIKMMYELLFAAKINS